MKSKSYIGFIGLLLINFAAMFLIAASGVYSYTIAAAYNSMGQVSLIFALECAARSVTIPLGGRLGDKIGQKKLFLSAVAAYIVFYGIASFATSFWVFTIAHMFTGFCWGLFMMNAFVLITSLFGQEQAPKYSGWNQSVTTVAMIVAAPLAGVICALNWRVLFWACLILLIAGFVMCCIGLPETDKKASSGRFDIPGVIFTAVFAIPLTLMMNMGNTLGWGSRLIITLMILTIAGIVGLVFSEAKAESPIFPYKLLKNRYYLCILMLMFIFSVLNGAANYLPTYAQMVLGTGSQIAGLINMPGLIIAVFLTTYFGNSAAKTGKYRPMVVIWAVCSVIGSLFWFFLRQSGVGALGLVFIFAGAVPIGAVNSVNQIAPYTYPMVVLSPEDLPSGLAFMGLAGALGSTLSGGICGALMNSSGGLYATFRMPIFCAVLMMVFALMFRDVRSSEKEA